MKLFAYDIYRHDNLCALVELIIDGGVDATAEDLCSLCRNKAQRSNLTNVVQLFSRKEIDVTWKNSDRTVALDLLRETWKHDEIDPHLIELLSVQINASEKHKKAQIVLSLAELGFGLKVDLNEFYGMTRVNMIREICMQIPSREDLWRLIRSSELLIEEGSFDVNDKYSYGMTVLHIFIQLYPYENLIDLLRVLIVTKGTDVNYKNSLGVTVPHILFLCYRHGNLIEVVQLLIEHGGDITAKTPKGLFICYARITLFIMKEWRRRERTVFL